MRYCKNKKGYLPIKSKEIKDKERVYIHYNSDKYDKERLRRAVNDPEKHYLEDSLQYKPHGLWASPEKCDLSWKEWCEDDDFYIERLEKSFKFKLSPKARILRINRLKDAYKHIVVEVRHFIFDPDLSYTYQKLDIAQIYHYYDGMEVIMSNDYINLHHNRIFYWWDVDSLCVWNPDVIIPVK